MHEGTCLCGATKFTLSGALRSSRYCHCSNCRKFAGTAPAAWAMADRAGLTVASSTAPVTRYDSGRGIRCFCSRCGSPLWFESRGHPEIVAIPLGVLDGGDVAPPAMHLWTRSVPPWYRIRDDLPRHDTNPG